MISDFSIDKTDSATASLSEPAIAEQKRTAKGLSTLCSMTRHERDEFPQIKKKLLMTLSSEQQFRIWQTTVCQQTDYTKLIFININITKCSWTLRKIAKRFYLINVEWIVRLEDTPLIGTRQVYRSGRWVTLGDGPGMPESPRIRRTRPRSRLVYTIKTKSWDPIADGTGATVGRYSRYRAPKTGGSHHKPSTGFSREPAI